MFGVCFVLVGGGIVLMFGWYWCDCVVSYWWGGNVWGIGVGCEIWEGYL